MRWAALGPAVVPILPAHDGAYRGPRSLTCVRARILRRSRTHFSADRTGYDVLSSDELNRALRTRGVSPDEIERAVQVLSAPDPAGIVPAPTHEQVGQVAAYMARLIDRVRVRSPYWRLIEQGDPAARAIFWHELQEIQAYRQFGITNPFDVRPRSADYWRAHAWACWEEARYWSAWARTEGQDISPEAFLLAHPGRVRAQSELPRIRRELRRTWSVTVRSPGVVRLQRADAFYQQKGLR